jgi:ABC-type transport system substrate-binding protein
VRTLDPARGYDTYSVAVIHTLATGLLDYDEKTNLRPDLAASWSASEDRRKYAFTLHPGIRFANGRPVTSRDFKYALERVLDPATASPGASFYQAIEGAAAFRQHRANQVSGIRTPDDDHIGFRLAEPSAVFPYTLAMTFAAAVPREVVEKAGPGFGDQPVGAGPYRLVQWSRGRSLDLERIAPEPPHPQKIHLDLAIPDTTQMARFQTGALEATSSVPAADLPQLMADPKWSDRLATAVVNQTWYMGMNTRRPPFDDERVRQAVNYAVDREKQARLAGAGQPAYQILPPQMPGYEPDYRPYPRDLQKARDLLAQAGHPGGVDAVMLIVAEEPWRRRAQGLQADLQEAGIRVQIRELEFATYLSAYKQESAQCWYGGWFQDFPDPSNFLEVLFSSKNITPKDSLNSTRYANPEVDRLLEHGRRMPLDDARLALYREVQRKVMADAPWAPLYYEVEAHAHQRNVTGAEPHPVWRYLRLAAMGKTASR